MKVKTERVKIRLFQRKISTEKYFDISKLSGWPGTSGNYMIHIFASPSRPVSPPVMYK